MFSHVNMPVKVWLRQFITGTYSKSISLPSDFFARDQIWTSSTVGLLISYVGNKCQGEMPKSGVGKTIRYGCQRVLNTRAYDGRWVGEWDR